MNNQDATTTDAPAQSQNPEILLRVVAIGFGILFLSSAIKGAYQVYFRDLADLFQVSRAQFAMTGGIFGLAVGAFSPLVGSLCDRYGPFVSILSGALAASLAFALLGLSPHYGLFLLAYGLVAAYALAAMTFVPMGVLVDRLFSRRSKGLAYAAMTNGVAIGFILLSPLWVWLNTWLSWQLLVLGLSLAFLLLVALPFYSWGRALPLGPGAKAGAREQDDARLGPHLTKAPFLLLALSFAGCGASMAFIDLHYVPLVQEQWRLPQSEIAPILAASLSVLGVLELVGGIWVGWLIGRRNPAVLLALLYAVRAGSMLLLATAAEPWMATVFAALFGLTYMGTVIITSMMCLQLYGTAIKGRMFGILFAMHQAAVFVTAYLGGLAHDLTGGYQAVVLGVGAVAGMSALAGLGLWRLGMQDRLKADPASQSLETP